MYIVIPFVLIYIVYVLLKYKSKYEITLDSSRRKSLYLKLRTIIEEYDYIHNLNGDKDKTGFQVNDFIIKRDTLKYLNSKINLPRRKCKRLFKLCLDHNEKFVKQRDEKFYNNKLNKLNEFIGG